MDLFQKYRLNVPIFWVITKIGNLCTLLVHLYHLVCIVTSPLTVTLDNSYLLVTVTFSDSSYYNISFTIQLTFTKSIHQQPILRLPKSNRCTEVVLHSFSAHRCRRLRISYCDHLPYVVCCPSDLLTTSLKLLGKFSENFMWINLLKMD